MDTLNERIREVRKALKLSQKELAGKIGISQRAVSWGEQPGNNVPDSTIKSLCIILHVNESWLRTGNGSMFTDIDALSLDKIARENGCTALEFKILKIYFEMDRETRLAVARHFRKRLSDFLEGEDLDIPIFEADTINPSVPLANSVIVQAFSASDEAQEPEMWTPPVEGSEEYLALMNMDPHDLTYEQHQFLAQEHYRLLQEEKRQASQTSTAHSSDSSSGIA